MSQQAPGGFTYNLDTITQKVPPESGVYALFSRTTCVYVGESDDVCAGLLEAYYEDNPCLNDKEITHFGFDLVPPEARVARQVDRIREFRPFCNLQEGGPQCSQCRLGQGLGPGELLAIAESPCN
jgi:hypothetical protein